MCIPKLSEAETVTESTPEPSGRKNVSKDPEFAKIFAESVRRPYERSLTGRLGIAVGIALVTGGLVVGGGATFGRTLGHTKQVSAESPYQPTPGARPPLVAPPTHKGVQHATKMPTASSAPPSHGGVPSAAKSARKHSGGTHHGSTFSGISGVLIHNSATSMCADLPDYGKGTTNGPVNQFPCAKGSGDNQVWSLTSVAAKGPGGVHLLEIHNAKDGLCMDLPNYGPEPSGTKVNEYPCLSTTQGNDLWYVGTTGGGYHIHNYKSHGLCLGVTGGAGAGHDARLEIHSCGSADTWTWLQG